MKPLIFTYLLTYGGAVVSLFHPFKGFLIYVVFAILRPEVLWPWAVPFGGNYSRIVALALLAGWAINGFGDWSFGRARPIVFALVGYLLWSAVSATFAVADTSVAWAEVEEYAKIVLPFLVAITTVRTLSQLKQLAWAIVLAQGYLALEFNQLYYTWSQFDPNDWTFGGLDRNGIAITMVTSLGLAGFLGLYAERWWQKLLALAAAGLMVHVVLFSMSRGGMLALVITAGITCWILPKRPGYVALMMVGIIVGLRLAGPQVVERFHTTFDGESVRDTSAQSRVDLWWACIKVMMAYPAFGIGSNNWRLVAHQYGFDQGKDAHTMWLHVGAEMGMVGLALLLTFYGACVLRLWPLGKNQSHVPDPWFRHIAHMVIASIGGFAISAQFVSVYAIELPFYVVLLGAGALKLCSVEVVAHQPPTQWVAAPTASHVPAYCPAEA
jgi:probable O-glycosylation ligase (exosortase A-associated)